MIIFEQLNYIYAKVSLFHLNILFLLGLALFGGTIGGRLFQKLRIPQVVGYIAIGIVIGQSGFGIVSHNVIETFEPFNYFALGLIGFMIGGELKKEVFSKYGKQLIYILLSEGIAASLMVFCLVGIVGSFFLGTKTAWTLGLLLGAIASATAPAATTEVLREYRTRGPLTKTVLGIVAMDDGLALLLFAIASSIAGNLSGYVHEGALKTFIHPLYEIAGSIFIGAISGLILTRVIRKYSEEDRILAFSTGTVLLVVGLALVLNVDMLIAAMTLGVMLANFEPRRSKAAFKLVAGFTPPIYVLFFVLVGAKLNFSHMTLPIALLFAVYIIGRSAGKMIGSDFGARISGAPKSVQRYLPLCLFSQAGVAIGLSILASHYFPGDIGNAVVVIITATTFVLELIGPWSVRLAIVKANEVGLNITEEDLIRTSKAKDIMDKSVPFMHRNTSMGEILKIFCESPNLCFPVLGKGKRLLGIITIDNIKNTFMETSLNHFFLADDLMEPAVATTTPDAPISTVKELFSTYTLEYLPVVTEEKKLMGIIERRQLDRLLSKKMMELRKRVSSLEAAS